MWLAVVACLLLVFSGLDSNYFCLQVLGIACGAYAARTSGHQRGARPQDIQASWLATATSKDIGKMMSALVALAAPL